MSFQKVLESLNSTPNKYSFNVIEFPLRKDVFIGFDSENRACVFIKSLDRDKFPSIRTDKLLIEFGGEYQLFVAPEKIKKELFHSIRCQSNDSEDNRIFATIIESILSDSSTQLNSYSLTSIFYSLVSLFKTTTSPDVRQARQGLWSELFFMKQFGGFKKWVPVWHSDPTRLFDFSYDHNRIEIKSTLRTERIHEFSHKQLFSLASEDIAVVSILLREDDIGTSLKSLIDEARTVLKGTHYLIRLERAIVQAAMNDTTQEGPRYNESEAKQNLAWFKVEHIPRFQAQEPEGVSGTHYKSDLTRAPSMSPEQVEQWTTLWNQDQVG